MKRSVCERMAAPRGVRALICAMLLVGGLVLASPTRAICGWCQNFGAVLFCGAHSSAVVNCRVFLCIITEGGNLYRVRCCENFGSCIY